MNPARSDGAWQARICAQLQDPRYPALDGYASRVQIDGRVLGVGDTSAPLTNGTSLHVDLQPRNQVAGPVEVLALVGTRGHFQRLPASFAQADSGFLRASVPRGELSSLSAGDYELVFFVGRPKTLPDEAEARRLADSAASSAPTGSFLIVRDHFTIADRWSRLPRAVAVALVGRWLPATGMPRATPTAAPRSAARRAPGPSSARRGRTRTAPRRACPRR